MLAKWFCGQLQRHSANSGCSCHRSKINPQHVAVQLSFITPTHAEDSRSQSRAWQRAKWDQVDQSPRLESGSKHLFTTANRLTGCCPCAGLDMLWFSNKCPKKENGSKFLAETICLSVCNCNQLKSGWMKPPRWGWKSWEAKTFQRFVMLWNVIS